MKSLIATTVKILMVLLGLLDQLLMIMVAGVLLISIPFLLIPALTLAFLVEILNKLNKY